MRISLRQLAVLLLLVVLTATGCSRQPQQTANTLRYVLEAEPATLDPAKSTAIPESLAELQLFEGLTRLDAKDRPLPGVATQWEISADGLRYIFHLRPDARWSNGEALTAHDFVYSWRRALDPETASENSYMLYALKNGQAFNEKEAAPEDVGVRALDERTLEVTLEKPTAYFLSLASFHAFYPVHRASIEKAPESWSSQAETLIGNGPFRLTGWVHHGSLSFAKNPYYRDAASIRLVGMYWPIVDAQATRLTLVETGQADMMVEPPVVEHDRLQKEGLLRIAPYLGLYYYVFNTQAPPFDRLEVRRAFALSFQRQALITHVVKGGKLPAYAWVPPGLTNPATGLDFRQEGGDLSREDAAAAKEALQKAGYGNALPPVTLLFNTGEMHKAIAEAAQEMWKQSLGVAVTLTNQESKVFLASRTRGEFQIARASWIGDYADPMTFLDVFKDATNDARYQNPRYNALIEEAQSALDPARRMAAMHEAEQILLDDAVILPIYYTTQPYVASPRLQGVSWSVLGLADFKDSYLLENR
ncbi:peptide ABC transporter substrate-binding protein [uncultured Anaeromusa sp.]|uniref:peptide ABC transporter substrate-binding protein n=1 Tax=uncultured Anaeromusa sp. TaxID=673273 RepID=UPI0029C8A654|nr:peptide ABC transporter substrate-binding protein [uncultured Anaeromusa sp.]